MTKSKMRPRIISFSLVLAFAASVLHASLTSAQVGEIRISALDYTPLCYLEDFGPGVKTLHVLHLFDPGSTAVRFKIETGPGVTLTYLSEVHHFASTEGNTQDGIAICYESCGEGTNQPLVSISYMSYGTSSDCSRILVVPHPAAQTVDAVGCDGIPMWLFAGDLVIERTTSCGCGDAHGFPGTPELFDCNPVPVATSTWGAIKALYR
jgi:hypothetical protein